MPTVTFKGKVQELEDFESGDVVDRYIAIPGKLKWGSHLGKREQWRAIPRAWSLVNYELFPQTVRRWVLNACGISRYSPDRVYILKDGVLVTSPGVTVDESGFLASVTVEINEEHTLKRVNA